MTEKRGFFGEQILSGNALKYFAAALMVCDHLHEFFFPQATWLNMLGRLVLPIFLFMVAEGFFYTHSRKRYLLQLLIGYWVMSLLNILFSRLFPIKSPDAPALANNIFSTMFVSALFMLCIDFIISGVKEKRIRKIIGGSAIMLAYAAFSLLEFVFMGIFAQSPGGIPAWLLYATIIIPNLFAVEAGFSVVILAVLFYVLRRWRLAQLLALAAFGVLVYVNAVSAAAASQTPVSIQWMMAFAVIPLFMYNGKRGKGGAFSKWFFYIFYPLHIYAMYFILYFMQR